MSCDFSVYDKDQVKQACDLTLSQFRRSQILLGVQSAINNQSIDLYQSLIDAMQLRCLDDAVGVQLDIIGRIVGQSRELENYGTKNWFAYDTAEVGYDQGIYYINGAPVGGNLLASDFTYRQLIYARIFKNHVKYGSVPEILQVVKLVYGINISIRKEGLSDISLVVPSNTPQYIVQNLTKVDDTPTTDRVYFLPIPSTGRIVDVIFRPPNAFTYDGLLPDEGYDQGHYAV